MKLILKARTGLVKEKKEVTRGGKTYTTTVWVRKDKKKGSERPSKQDEKQSKKKQVNQAEIDSYGEEELQVLEEGDTSMDEILSDFAESTDMNPEDIKGIKRAFKETDDYQTYQRLIGDGMVEFDGKKLVVTEEGKEAIKYLKGDGEDSDSGDNDEDTNDEYDKDIKEQETKLSKLKKDLDKPMSYAFGSATKKKIREVESSIKKLKKEQKELG
jgi:hypothetical protein